MEEVGNGKGETGKRGLLVAEWSNGFDVSEELG